MKIGTDGPSHEEPLTSRAPIPNRCLDDETSPNSPLLPVHTILKKSKDRARPRTAQRHSGGDGEGSPASSCGLYGVPWEREGEKPMA
ncbi:hypothetical protein FKM82_022659 [Ascaphus truei]